jgi:hypothetical protein
MNRVRRKIDTKGFKPLLHTRRGAGYVLSSEVTPDGKSPETRRRDDV